MKPVKSITVAGAVKPARSNAMKRIAIGGANGNVAFVEPAQHKGDYVMWWRDAGTRVRRVRWGLRSEIESDIRVFLQTGTVPTA